MRRNNRRRFFDACPHPNPPPEVEGVKTSLQSQFLNLSRDRVASDAELLRSLDPPSACICQRRENQLRFEALRECFPHVMTAADEKRQRLRFQPGFPASRWPPAPPADVRSGSWESGLEAEAMELLASGRHDVWEELTKRFESKLILTALANTRGRRIEAAQKLGIGRNTITRKIQELGLE